MTKYNLGDIVYIPMEIIEVKSWKQADGVHTDYRLTPTRDEYKTKDGAIGKMIVSEEYMEKYFEVKEK